MSRPPHLHAPTDSSPIVPPSGGRERLELAEFSFARSPSGQCSAQVSLGWTEQSFVGRAMGHSSTLGDLRVCAEAALRALQEFVNGALQFELLGIKHIRAFDSDVVIVSVSARHDGETTRLVGCCLATADTERAAAMAVLNATNRLVGNYTAAR